MNKFKYFLWKDPNLGFGEGETLFYINAKDRNEAIKKLKKRGFKHDPHFIIGDVKEVKEFIQPKQIKII